MHKDSKRNFKKENSEVNHHREQKKLNCYLEGNVQPQIIILAKKCIKEKRLNINDLSVHSLNVLKKKINQGKSNYDIRKIKEIVKNKQRN